MLKKKKNNSNKSLKEEFINREKELRYTDKLWSKVLKFIDPTQFHLCRTLSHWSLVRQYEDSKVYLSNDNEIILEGTYSKEDIEKLYNYLQTHQRKDPIKVLFRTISLIEILFVILCFANIFIKNKAYSDRVWCVNLILILIMVVMERVRTHNFRVSMRNLKDNLERDMQEEYTDQEQIKE